MLRKRQKLNKKRIVQFGRKGVFVFATLMIMMAIGCNRGEIVSYSYDDVAFEKDGKEESEKEESIEIDDKESMSSKDDSKNLSEQSNEAIMVYVCGKVNAPGVYELPANARVFQAIEAAGGMTKDADTISVNQAAALEDGEQIYVPAEGEEAIVATGNMDQSDQRVNLNTATREELMTLPGIGESKADSIIRYREEHGKFSSTDELMNITGIKDGVYQKVKDQIKVK